MKFNIKKTGQNILVLGRKIGYIPQKANGNETAFTRSIQRDFPRFHLYIRELETEFIFNLHLDQKKPTYGDHTAHSGEYEGELVENEAARIKNLLVIKDALIVDVKSISDEAVPKEKRSIASLFKKLF